MLEAAHRGYDYQDLMVALRLVDVVFGSISNVWVDEKLVEDDRFDDLSILDLNGGRLRTQFKHRDDGALPLPLDTFTSEDRDLRLDRLVAAAIADRDGPGRASALQEFRLVLRDARPNDPRLTAVLRPASPDPGPFVGSMPSVRLRFDVSALWPATPATADDPHVRAFERIRTLAKDRAELEWLCERLIIEVEAPDASFDLLQPGTAERLLLERVAREIGAGSYPNEDRAPVDVAASIVGLARAARQRSATVSRDELLRRMRLRQDFGAVARAHPVDPSVEVSRASTVSKVVAGIELAAAAHVPLLVLGPPGQGKSWACQRAIDELEKNGWLIAEHYCFLGVGDLQREDRVKVETVLGSLLARLAERDPELVQRQRPRFSADEQQLTEIIRAALRKDPNRRVALVVDGLDHVTRVVGATSGRPDPSHVVAQALATLEMPDRAIVVALSQPGEHLGPFHDAGARQLELDGLSSEELRSLAVRVGVLKGPVQQRGAERPREREEEDALIAALEERSKGNALYATYLAREAILRPSIHLDPVATIRSLPAFDGTLESYYTHLVGSLGDGRWVADLLAQLAFAVTRAELGEIWPEFSYRVDDAIDRLAPVLQKKATQGGLRVYHESFARFLQAPVRANEASRGALRGRVIEWLRRKGLLHDTRAFRFLLPSLVEAGRDADVLSLVDADFATQAVAAGFAPSAILANLGTAIECAMRLSRWSDAVRFVELGRAVHTFEDERLDATMVTFADVPIALFGADMLAARLLDNGFTTLPARVGLKLCAAIDIAGGNPPWSEYLTAFGRESERDRTSYGRDSDLEAIAALVRGELRVAKDDRERRSVAEWAAKQHLSPTDLVKAVCETSDMAEMSRLLSQLPNKGDVALAMTEWALANDEDSSAPLLIAAVEGVSPGKVSRLFALGVSVDQLTWPNLQESLERLRSLAVAVQVATPSEESVWAWLDECAVCTRRDSASLVAAEVRITGAGWYRCWLRFTIALCRAEARVPSDRGVGALEALRLLISDLDPFAGTPRACDLYSLREAIASTLRRAVSLLDDASWAPALEVLRRVASGVNTTLFGEISGPVPQDLLLRMALDYTNRARNDVTRSFVASVITELSSGRYYGDLAAFHLFASRMALTVADRAAALAHWVDACRMLVAYGFHKDTTIFELLDPIRVLISTDPGEACSRLAVVHPLCFRVMRHTDGDETRHALTRWWELLAAADPMSASRLAAQAILAKANLPDACLERARTFLWRAQYAAGDPVVASALRLTLASALEADDPKALDLLANQQGTAPCRELFDMVVARADERPARYSVSNSAELVAADTFIVANVNAVARRLSRTTLSPIVVDVDGRAEAAQVAPAESEADWLARLEEAILQDFGKGVAAVGSIVRELRRRPYDARGPRWAYRRLENAIGYRLLELIDANAEADVESTVRLVASAITFGDGVDVVAGLADGLERHGYNRLASVAHALSWTSQRGGGGWQTFGEETGIESLRRAAQLDPVAARSVVAGEMQRLVQRGRGSLYGVTQAVVFALATVDFGPLPSGYGSWGAVALEAWDAAAEIISCRAPRVDDRDDLESPYVPEYLPAGAKAIDEALAMAALAGVAHPAREQKRRSLLALRILIHERPAILGKPLETVLRSLREPTTLSWLLSVLVNGANAGMEAAVRESASSLQELCAMPQLVVRSLARDVLAKYSLSAPSLPVGEAPLQLIGDDRAVVTRTSDAGETKERAVVRMFADSRLRACETMLPNIRVAVENGTAQRLESPELRARMKGQLDALASRADFHWPDAVLADGECVEDVLQRLGGLGRSASAARGELLGDPVGWELGVSMQMLNDPTLALDLETVREARPELAEPPGRGSPEWRQISALAPAKADDWLCGSLHISRAEAAPCVREGKSTDWRIIASVESRVVPAGWGTKVEDMVSRRCCALELRESGLTVALDRPPLGRGDLRTWSARSELVLSALDGSAPLLGEDYDQSICGDGERGLGWRDPLLAPMPLLVSFLRLRPGRERFEMVDDIGPGLRLRIWRTCYTEGEYELSRPLLWGTQVLLRPDLFATLCKSAVHCVWRECLSGSAGLVA